MTPLDKKDKDFKQFDSLLSQSFHKGGMCLGCSRYEVTATLVGRIDGVADTTLARDKDGKIIGFGGFGNMNAYPVRLVLQSVTDVVAKELDYSKSVAVTKDDSGPDTGGSDALDAVRKVAKAYGATDPSGIQLSRAADAFGKDNAKNTGVVVSLNNGNEAGAKADGKGMVDSTDGLLFTVTINNNRANGDAVIRSYALAGETVANLRNPLPGGAGAPLFLLENRALVTVVLDAIASQQKTLTLPGGSIIWNKAWPQADVNTKLGDAIQSFITENELIRR